MELHLLIPIILLGLFLKHTNTGTNSAYIRVHWVLDHTSGHDPVPCALGHGPAVQEAATAALGSWNSASNQFKTASQYTCNSRLCVLAALWCCSKVSVYIAAAVFRVGEASGGSSALYRVSQNEHIKMTSKRITVNWNNKQVLRKIQILSVWVPFS
jgi:hypothetical protein